MTHHWDEFSKSLAEPVPRRESLRRLGIAISATVLGPLGAQFASAAPHHGSQSDPCKAFCQCRNSRQKDQCLKACKACNKNTSRLAGSCGSYVCCGNGQTSCGSYCADLASDPDNCGACGNVCAAPGPNEYGTCIFGECEYACYEGAVYCGGTCTFLDSDPDNCGACGNVCPESAPFCSWGECTGCASGLSLCGGQCVDTLFDANNCGGCGQACPTGHVCSAGSCCDPTISDCGGGCQGSCPEGWCGGDGCGGECACPSGMYCEGNWCVADCPFPFILCGGACVDPTSDPFNCGGCFNQCAPNEVCAGGFCQGFGGDPGW